MNIKPILSLNNPNYQRKQISQNPSFGQGKVNAYFDFDNTYCPASHSGLKHMSPSEHPGFVEYCTNFKNFFNNTREGLTFHITTGRTLGEYNAVSYLVKMRGFELPLPDSVITKNGSDEYIKQGSDEDFYKNGNFPFNSNKRNTKKEEDIKKLTGWDGPKIKEGLKKIFKSHDLRIVEADSEHSPNDYGPRSLFSDGKLRYEDHIPLKDGMNPTSDWNVGLRNDGNLKIFYTLPYDTDFCQERADAAKAIDEEIGELLINTGAKQAYRYDKQHHNECGGRPYCVTEPMIDKDMSWYGAKETDQGLSKFYDTQQAVKKAIEDNDLVIAAGDSSNDTIMLSPSMYINVDCDLYPDLHSYKYDSRAFLDELQQNPEKYSDIIKQLEDLPFIGIVVKNNEKEVGSIRDIVNAFGEGSKYQKIIEVENGHLEDGVREAIKLHAARNPKFMEKLSPDLKKEIFGIVEEIKDNVSKTSHPGKTKTKTVLFAALSLGIMAMVLVLAKHIKNKKDITHTAQNRQNIKDTYNPPANFSQTKLPETFKDFKF